MHRTYRVAAAAGAFLARAALGFVVLMAILAMVALPPEPAGSVANSSTVTLRVPEGELAGNLRVVDASGRELAMLTYFSDDEIVLVARRIGGTSMSVWLPGNGAATVRMTGSSQSTTVRMEPDGTTRSEKTGA